MWGGGFMSKKSKSVIEQMMDSMKELLEFTIKNANAPLQGEPPKEVYDQLKKLEQDVQRFRQFSDKMVKEAGLSEQQIAKILQGPFEQYNEEAARLLQKAGQLKEDLEKTQNQISADLERIKKRERASGKEGEVSKKIARRKKFGRLGGKSGWMPL